MALRLTLKNIVLTASIYSIASPLHAGMTEVIAVDAQKSKNEQYNFAVTLRHTDTGWEHFANKWDVIGADGVVYGTRILHHPHVEEQPFTRSLTGVSIPKDVKVIFIHSYDTIHGRSDQEYKVELPQ